ncbi:MAG: D-2-hydroxyacid dehydrogenase [Gammaproteobacteria bacterium]|nr:D-2-hydroxyacid dehydrogenase [Gammaproteobacteria bacterium]
MKPVLLVQGVKHIDEVPRLAELRDQAEIRCASSAEDLRTMLPGAEVMLGWNFRAASLREAWSAVDSLRWIHWAGAGVDAAMFDELVASDIQFTNARGVFDQPMAEWVLGMIIAFAKGFPETLACQARGEWQHRLSEQVAGKRALVVGVGSIGRAVGRLLKAVDMEVEVVGRSARDGDPDFGHVFAIEELPACLPRVDYVVLITPLTEQTRGLFAANEFAAMKPQARFINIGRGALVVEDALLSALQAGGIAGAALDVFVEEPLPPQSPFWTAPNCLVSPHMSGDYAEFETTMAAQFIENWRRYLAGEALLNRVDKRLGFAEKITTGS